MKANPATEITELLRDKGSNFDIASIYELDKVMKTGVGPERISYGNTIKKSKDIRYFYEKGVRLFATDSEADLRNIAKAAPGAKVVRILTEGSTTADWPLSRVRLPDRHGHGPADPGPPAGPGALRHFLPRRFAAARHLGGTRRSPRSR